MRRQYSAIAFAVLLGACAASDDSKSNAPVAPSGEIAAAGEGTTTGLTPEPEVIPETATATPSIASVQLKQDCPDPKSQAKGSSALAPGIGNKKAKRKRDSSSGSFQQPCSQSTLQLAFTGQQGKSSVATLKAVRLQLADGTGLGSLATRMPTIWILEEESRYVVWDGTIEPGVDHKASYKLSVPDWGAIETTLGGSSYGRMYTVEVDVEIDGKVTTLTSPQFERGRPQIMKT